MPNHLAGPAAPIRVLVIGEDERRRADMKAAIEAGGYDVETAANGPSAARKIREGRYDLVLFDDGTPGTDGPATAQLIHDLVDVRLRPRLVALAATPDGTSVDGTASDEAFDGVVPRPPDTPAVLEVVDRCPQVALDGGRRSTQ